MEMVLTVCSAMGHPLAFERRAKRRKGTRYPMNLTGEPSQMTAFDILYSIAARDGRREVQFGNSLDIARDTYKRTLIGDGYPAAYLESPLLGSPGFDLLSVRSTVWPGRRFATEAGFGCQAKIYSRMSAGEVEA